ncbi:hypothetical protein PHJA_001131700 [Phtheirospermum japonicum]|uniref:Uncharacterized protein n=1 Tax=Phtheirospermum japonicum TaxID=374723 RepID=A0A830BUQ5_9LAMI|nr:hypothetical protein PHJA_001131700 [Phtheirospermum japonicum]
MVNPSSPPPIARLPRILALKPMVWSVVASSVTQQVIANYWKQRRMIEEDHLSEAIKTVARIRSRNLSDNDYLDFVHSLELEDDENSQRQRE